MQGYRRRYPCHPALDRRPLIYNHLAMHWTALLEKRTFPPHARICGDLMCIGCGYNLRGSRVEGPCPECGVTVGASLYELARPDEVASAVRTIARSYLFIYIMILPLIAMSLVGMDTLLLALAGVGVGAIFRLVGAIKLRFGSALAPLPVIGIWLRAVFAVTIIDAAWHGLALVGWYIVHRNPVTFGATVQQWRFWILCSWLMLTLVHLWTMGRLGARLATMLEYRFCKRELLIQHILLLAGPVLAFLLAVAGLMLVLISGYQITTLVIVGVGGLCLALVWLLAVAYTSVALIRLAGAAEKEREPLDDLVDLERGALDLPRRAPKDEPDVPLA